MANNDTYQTLESYCDGIYKEKGSKFHAYAWPVNNVDDVKVHLENLKELHPKARHHCYAYQFGTDGNNYRANDAGEPNGTAGLPILGQIKSFEITNVLIVVVRYFGGTKLGASGLINAYKTAAQDALSNGTIIEKVIADHYKISFEYDQMNNIMRLCKEHQINIEKQDFELHCNIIISLRQSESETIIQLFDTLQNVNSEYLYTL